jgi:predicted metal-dependent phosphoesterase TrpH
MIDLHCHSTASDGTDSPTELVANAVAAGLRTIAITDHDTTGGWDEAATAVAELPVNFTLIRGTEFSCVHTAADGGRISLHLLGYLFDPDSDGLRSERARLRESRLGRGEAIVDALVTAGYPISWQQVSEIAGSGAVGRPHIGQALQQAGVVADVNEAFAELLSSSSPYYVPKADSPVLMVIELIRQAGGVAVIAHPWARRRGTVLDEQALTELVAAGMAGIEVDHVDHSAADRQRLRELAADLGAFCTGSSDYHGTHKAVRLGAETTDPRSLDRLLALASGVEPLHSPGAE